MQAIIIKKDKKTLTADKITYNDPTKVSFAEGHTVYKEEQTKGTACRQNAL